MGCGQSVFRAVDIADSGRVFGGCFSGSLPAAYMSSLSLPLCCLTVDLKKR